jgi:hypothetical protein
MTRSPRPAQRAKANKTVSKQTLLTSWIALATFSATLHLTSSAGGKKRAKSQANQQKEH